MKTIRWGIIGCGNVTEKKSGPAFRIAENSDLVAVMRRSADKAGDYARRHQVEKWYSNAGDLINDPDVDAVYIATPPDSHQSYTSLVARAGKPVYVEKPMARTHSECLQMIDDCRINNVPLFVAYYRRSLPRFLKVKELLDSQAIGNIRLVNITLYQPVRLEDKQSDNLPWRVIPEISGGGYFFDLASHTLDILDFYFGPIASATGYARNQQNFYPAEDIVTASFVFENGITGSGVWSFGADRHVDVIEIVGDKGTITLSTFLHPPIRLITGNEVQEFHIDHPQHIQQPHIQSIVDELNGAGKCPGDGISAARTSKIMDMIVKI